MRVGVTKLRRIGKRIVVWLILGCLLIQTGFMSFSMQVWAAPDVTAPSYIVMEASTGQVVCEQDADTRRSPASITKIMTLLVIFEHIKSGRIHLEDLVTTSAYAKSMGGSQVFLEEGETQTLETMIKCIAVASGNDASVAVAEYIAGSEGEFVKLMNEKAEALGMQNTHFVDCCGLTDSDDHYSSAKDVAIMSRELITKYPEVFQYTRIWMVVDILKLKLQYLTMKPVVLLLVHSTHIITVLILIWRFVLQLNCT